MRLTICFTKRINMMRRSNLAVSWEVQVSGRHVAVSNCSSLPLFRPAFTTRPSSSCRAPGGRALDLLPRVENLNGKGTVGDTFHKKCSNTILFTPSYVVRSMCGFLLKTPYLAPSSSSLHNPKCERSRKNVFPAHSASFCVSHDKLILVRQSLWHKTS